MESTPQFPEDHLTDAPPEAQHLQIRGPAALAAALPYLVPCPQQGRIVLAIIGPGSILKAAAHRSLPAYPSGASPELQARWADDVGATVRDGLDALEGRGTEHVALVIYLPEQLRRPPRGFAERVLRDAGSVPVTLLDALAVFRGRWCSLVCREEQCCPAEGVRILDDQHAVDAAAALIAAGTGGGPSLLLTPGEAVPDAATRDGQTSGEEAPDRPTPVALSPVALPPDDRELGDTGPLAMPSATDVAAGLAATRYPDSIDRRGDVLSGIWPLVAAGAASWSAESAALAVLAADRPGIRDALIIRMAVRGGITAHRGWWRQQRELWTAIADVAPQGWSPGPQCLRAIGAWALGEFDEALDAVADALQVEPGHRMAGLLDELIGQHHPASQWFVGMMRIEEVECLRFDRPPPAGRSSGPEQLPRTG